METLKAKIRSMANVQYPFVDVWSFNFRATPFLDCMDPINGTRVGPRFVCYLLGDFSELFPKSALSPGFGEGITSPRFRFGMCAAFASFSSRNLSSIVIICSMTMVL